MSDINGYTLTRNWYNFKFKNPEKVKHVHADLYFYIINLWNTLGQMDKFALPSVNTMHLLGIGNYTTYKRAFDDLIEWGFIELIAKAKNEHTTTVIAICKNEVALQIAPQLQRSSTANSGEVAVNTYMNDRTIEQENDRIDSKPAFNFKKSLIEAGANEDLVVEWMKVRKAKRLEPNKSAFDKFMRELEKSKRDINQVLRVCAERSWGGFESAWPFPDEQAAQITDDAAKWKAKLAELKSRQTVIEVTTDPTKPTYKILEYHNGKGMSYIAGVERMLEGWLQQHWELIPLVKEVEL